MKLLHLADVHLGASYSGFGALAAARAADVLDAFRRIPDDAAAMRADAVLVAGDLFDGPGPPTETVAAVRETLRRLGDLGVPTFLVPGNHDSPTLRLDPYRELARSGRVRVQRGDEDGGTRRDRPAADARDDSRSGRAWAYVLAAPRFRDPITVRTASGLLHVYGLAYDVAEAADPLPTFRRGPGPGVHVALLHASIRDADHWQGSANGLVAGRDRLATIRVDYVALGDHHRPRTPAGFGGLPACYPGSFAALDLTEDGPHGYVAVDVEPGGDPAVELRESGVTPVAALELDVAGCGDDIEVAERVMRRLPERCVPAVTLVGEPDFPLDAETVAGELRERYGHGVVTDETRYYAASRLDELAGMDTVAGHVVRLGRHRIEAAADDDERRIARQALRAALRALEVE
jgi:exonuclease SbcD